MTPRDENDDEKEGLEKAFGKLSDKISDAFNKIGQPKNPEEKPAAPQAPGQKAAPSADDLTNAIRRGKLPLAKQLLEAGADPNAFNSAGETALHVAARNDHVAAGQLLIDFGANPKLGKKDDPKALPLDDAVNFGKVPMAEFLTRNGGYAPGNTVNGWTLLHRAAEKGNPRLVAALIAGGADANEKTDNGSTPLLVAVSRRQQEVAEKLLDIPSVAGGMNEFHSQTDSKQRNAFQLAIEKGQASVVAKMLKLGVNINAADADGVTPLVHAIEQGNVALVKTLVSHGADINTVQAGRGTALYIASSTPEITDEKTRAQIIDILMRNGADPEIGAPITRVTPLHALLTNPGGEPAVRQMLRHPVNTSAKDMDGMPAIFYALKKPDVLEDMLRGGADINIRHGQDARTPLIQAVHDEAGVAVKLLIDKGANLRAVDAHGISALGYARAKKNTYLVEMLEEALAKQDMPRPKKGQEFDL
ncbi:MAG: ankyrin repeat domain-containing protein [Alphaproteobacteria bacterium]